jgi:hypothetical protein
MNETSLSDAPLGRGVHCSIADDHAACIPWSMIRKSMPSGDDPMGV